MTAKTDLLPLPEPVAVKYPDSGLRDDEHALRLWAAHGYDTGGEPLFSAEQLREATAPLQAEIEALRAELDIRDSIIATHAADTREYQKRISQAEARADKLAEALRLIESAKERGFGIDYARGVAQSVLLRDQEEGNG